MYSNLLFTADLHLRDTCPKCRTDDFVSAQWKKFAFIVRMCHEHNALWVDAGDFFHKAKPSLSLIHEVISRLNKKAKRTNGPFITTVAGNHDMPAHNLEQLNESGLGILEAAGYVKLLSAVPYYVVVEQEKVWLYGVSYGQAIPKPQHAGQKQILVYHGMIIDSLKNRIPGNNDPTKIDFLKQNPEYDVVISGHNHMSFDWKTDDGQALYNIGSMTRQTADKEHDMPKVLLWNPESTRSINLPFSKGVISREHIDKVSKKEEELNAFVTQLQNIEDVSLSFEENVKKVIKKTKPNKFVEQKIWEAVNGD